MKKPPVKVAKPGGFRGEEWCAVKGLLYRAVRGGWVEAHEFKVTGPNGAHFIHALYTQNATDFPPPVRSEIVSAGGTP